MRSMKLLGLFFGVLLLTNTVNAESPREQLKQMVVQLQANPNDDALREKIIKLAQKLKPSPAIPEDAERRMVRGTVAFKGAKSMADYRNAAKEFEQATLAAPWYCDAYFNLGVTQDKAEAYEAALSSLKLALLALPNSKDIKALIYEVEYRNEKAHSPELEAERQRAKDEAFIKSLDGAVFRRRAPCDFEKCVEEWEERVRGNEVEFAYRVASGTTQMRVTVGEWAVRGRCPIVGRRFKETSGDGQCNLSEYEIAPDGQSVRTLSNPPFVIYRQ